MVAAIQFQIVGLNLTIDQLKKIGADKLNKVNDAVHKEGFRMVDVITQDISTMQWETMHPRPKGPKTIGPGGGYIGPSVDTGLFMGSVGLDSDMTQPFISKVQSTLPYAKHLEYGTTKIPARQHFQRPLIENMDRIKKAIKESVQ